MQTTQSRAALSLLAVLAVAKAVALAGQHAPVFLAAPVVYFWQDVLAALVFGGLFRLAPRPWLIWAAYFLLTCYVALNTVVTLELSSPLSPAMIRAAGGPLADSIAHALTWRNIGALAVVIVAGATAPFVQFPNGRARPGVRTIVCAIVWVVAGAVLTPTVDTRGLHRNALAALVPTAAPVAAASNGAPADWRTSPYGATAGEDLRSERATARGANVLFIALESTAARYIGLYGADRDPMPNLTALARRGLVFDRMYAVYPESIRGLFSILCSRSPAYGTPVETDAGGPCVSLPKTLKDAGYRSALFHSGRFEYLGMRSVIEGRGFDVLEDAGAIGGRTDSSFGIDETSTVDRMLQWIDGLNGDQRFFVTYLPIEGHHPYATHAPGPFAGGTEFTQYLNALHESDQSLGRLLDGLRARGRDRDTLVVISGDHGEAFGQHPGNSGHSLFIYDENVHVPFLIAPPGWGADGPGRTDERRVARVGSLIDTAPTILDLLGLRPPALMQGRSLLEPANRMAIFFTDYALGWLGLTDGCWTFIYQVDSARSALYDVCRDPQETTDLAPALPDRTARYRERATQWAAASHR